jgi:hypothetical protein
VEAVLRDLAERRVDADIEARDVAAPPIIRFLSRPPQSLNAHHLRACPLLQIASLVAHRSATLRLSLCLTTISLGPTTPRALEKRSSHENAGAAVYQSRPVSSETRQSHESQSLSLTASLTRSLTQCRLKGGDPRLQVSHAGLEIDESKGWR